MQLVKAFIKDATFGIALLLIATAIGLAYISLPLFGHKTLIVRSGSMEPALKVGDLIVVTTQNPKYVKLALSKPLYEIGDVVAFKDFKSPSTLVTHRITGFENQNGKIFYKTKGDANKTEDTNLLPESNIVGKADVSITQVGQIFAFAKSKTGFATLVLFPAIVVVALESINIIKELRKKRSFPIIYTKAATTLKIFIPVVFSAFLFRYTYAYFSDSATSMANTFAAATSFPSPSPTSTPIPSPSPQSLATIVINEVYYDVASDKGNEGTDQNPDEWLELYNGSNITVNLKNWTISDNSSSENIANANQFVQPGQYVLIAKSNSTWNNWDEDPNAILLPIGNKIGNGLANTGDRVILKDSLGNIIDQMSYGSDITIFNPSVVDVAEGHSLERNPDGFDTDSPNNFIDSNPPTPGS